MACAQAEMVREMAALEEQLASIAPDPALDNAKDQWWFNYNEAEGDGARRVKPARPALCGRAAESCPLGPSSR
eukprot:3680037-Prymnesium_polylepis.1